MSFNVISFKKNVIKILMIGLMLVSAAWFMVSFYDFFVKPLWSFDTLGETASFTRLARNVAWGVSAFAAILCGVFPNRIVMSKRFRIVLFGITLVNALFWSFSYYVVCA